MSLFVARLAPRIYSVTVLKPAALNRAAKWKRQWTRSPKPIAPVNRAGLKSARCCAARASARRASAWRLPDILYAKGNRHISAEGLHEEAMSAKVPVSLATVYNTLHQFTEAGLLREVAVDGSKTYFDTNVTDHHHFFVEDDNLVIDIPEGGMGVGNIPEPPPGYEISRVDVVVRLRRIRG